MRLSPTLTTLGMLLAALSTPAYAHDGVHGLPALAAGLLHPFSGLDHLLAMLAVGVWSVQTSRQAGRLPLAFVLAMAAGLLLAAAGIALPMVEAGIAASVLVAGLLIAGAVRLPMAAGMALVGGFALLHGHAHGAAATLTLTYGLGVLASTALLHLTGMGLAHALRAHAAWLRAGGLLTGLGGALLLAGV